MPVVFRNSPNPTTSPSKHILDSEVSAGCSRENSSSKFPMFVNCVFSLVPHCENNTNFNNYSYIVCAVNSRSQKESKHVIQWLACKESRGTDVWAISVCNLLRIRIRRNPSHLDRVKTGLLETFGIRCCMNLNRSWAVR